MTTLFGITRVRNEALIIADTLEHFLEFCDHVVLYDDHSTDDTVAIARKIGRNEITIIRNREHRRDRNPEETRHRRIACHEAQMQGADWILCFDADERLVGHLPDLDSGPPGYTFRLFDGYLTQSIRPTYRGGDLATLPRLYGPEYRDILMLFRPRFARWNRTGLREPFFSGRIERADVFVKHFGKCLSVEQWEETCDYYMNGFPASFRQRWEARKGKAIHTRSDFGRRLFTWEELMSREDAWVKI